MGKIYRKGPAEKKILMIKRVSISTIRIAVMMSWLISTSFADEKIILHFGSSETPPFWSQTLFLDGMCGEILHEISKEIDVKSVIEYKPLTRLIDGVGYNLLGNPEFFLPHHEFVAIIPIAVYRSVFFYYQPHHKKKITFERIEDLKGYSVGVMKGSLANKPFFNRVGIKFEESYSKDSLFKKLELGRIDLSIDIDLSGLLAIKRLFPEKASSFARLEIPRSITPITIMIDSNYPNGRQLGKKYKKGFKTIIKMGKYHKILAKYYGRENIPGDWFNLLDRYQLMYDTVLQSD